MATERRRALVVHPGALGDVLQAVPALRALGAQAHVTFCGQPRLGELLAGAGVVDEATAFDGFGLEALFAGEPPAAALAERLGAFDEVVSWFGSRDEGYPDRLRALAPRCVVAPPQPGGAGPRAQSGGPRPADPGPATVWQHLLATLAPLRRAAPADRAPLVLPAAWLALAHRALDMVQVGAGERFVLVHPGAGGAWKLAPPDLLARAVAPVLRSGRVRPLLHVGPADRQAAERLAGLLDAPPPALIEPSLPALAGVLALAAAYLGGDSGVSHLAAAVGAPAVILFPAATRERWAPWSPTARPIAMAPDPAAAAAAAAALAEAVSARRSPAPLPAAEP